MKTQEINTQFKEGFSLLNIFKGIIIAYLVTIPFFIIFSIILSGTSFPEKYLPSVVFAITLLSLFISGIIATRNLISKGWINGSLVGLLYVVILMIVRWLINGSLYMGSQTLLMIVIGVLTGAIGGIIGVNIKHSRKFRQKNKGR